MFFPENFQIQKIHSISSYTHFDRFQLTTELLLTHHSTID